MQEHTQASWIIRLIAIKKGLFALILIAIAIVSGFGWRNYDLVTQLANDYVINAEYGFVHWILEHLAHTKAPTLKLISRIAGLYGVLLGTASIGIWFGKSWADPLFLLLLASLLPVEIYEILHQPTTTKLTIFVINAAIFLFFLNHWLSSVWAKQSETPMSDITP